MSKLQAISLSVLLLFWTAAEAKTLYVDATTGNDATSYESNSAGSPWRTIGRAAWGSTSFASPNPSQAAKPGDVVQIAAGIYWESGATSGGRFTVSLNPANSGTAAAPITFRGVGMVYLRMRAGFRGGMIGCNERNYIIWDNFQIDDYYGGSTSDTGPVVFSGNSRHCQLVNSDVKGHPGSYFHGYPTFGANYRGVSIEPAHSIIVRNNLIREFRGGQNECGVMLYDSNDNIIENNEFVGNGCAVFVKGIHPGATQSRNVIRRNVVRENRTGIRVLDATDTLVYQNIIFDQLGQGLWAGFFASTRSKFVNNTLYNNDRGFAPQGTELVDVLVQGNIFAMNRHAHYNWTVGDPSGQDVQYDHNLYYQNYRHAAYETGRSIEFPEWQSTFRCDVNGRLSDPRFVDAGARNFRLRADSPARSLSVDILDLNGNGSTTDSIPAGAYVTGSEIIGRSTEAMGQVPSNPQNVTVE